ncbi:MAG: hypothetical protein H6739_09405 [Alphaproteobacteria bacterium]|nr:hypothetical protein [Alphaproteobacteria bacterium]
MTRILWTTLLAVALADALPGAPPRDNGPFDPRPAIDRALAELPDGHPRRVALERYRAEHLRVEEYSVRALGRDWFRWGVFQGEQPVPLEVSELNRLVYDDSPPLACLLTEQVYRCMSEPRAAWLVSRYNQQLSLKLGLMDPS